MSLMSRSRRQEQSDMLAVTVLYYVVVRYSMCGSYRSPRPFLPSFQALHCGFAVDFSKSGAANVNVCVFILPCPIFFPVTPTTLPTCQALGASGFCVAHVFSSQQKILLDRVRLCLCIDRPTGRSDGWPAVQGMHVIP